MPTVSSLLSGSVSIGILAGVLSGLCYLVLAGIRWAGKLRSSLQAEGEEVGCSRCETSAPGRKCSVCARRRELKLQSGDWFYRHIQSRFFRTTSLPENSTAHDNGTAMEPESAQVREFIERLVEALVSGHLDDVKLNRLYTHPEYDRMFAYHHSALCENIVQLSFALQMAIMNKPLPVEETPSAVHAALKQRVQRVIEEAMTLPDLKSQVPVQNGSAIHKWDDDITSMTYEDILATAILNKVIEQFQQRTGVIVRDTVDGNHNLPSASSVEHAQTYISQVEIGVNNSDDCDTYSQEGLRSWSDSSHTEPLSMTVEQCIEEEVTTYDSAGEEDENRSSDDIATTSSELDFYLSGLSFIKHHRVPFPELGVDIVDGRKAEHYSEEDELSDSSEPTDLISPVDSWEENWLFQRRRLKAGGTTDSSQRSPIPVPMLVPNPSEEFKARIGDRDVEEVSDLSDCSDGALEDVVLAGLETNLADDHLPKVLVTSGSHEVSPDTPEGESIAAMDTERSVETEVTSASVNLAKAPSVECLSEFGQQDSEYTEDYASVTQRQIGSVVPEQISPAKVPVPKPRMLPASSQPEISPHQELSDDAKQDTELSAAPRPGTIAEREHRKWESAPPLPNNPYSPENINKRLSSQSTGLSTRSSSVVSIDIPEVKAASTPSPVQVICTSGELDYKRYGRDYYINSSKAASGERHSSSTSTSPFVQQVCDTNNLLDLEQQVLHRNIYRNSFRACNSASLNFTVNPLFEQEKSKTVQTEDIDHKTAIVETVSVIDGVLVRDGVRINPLFECQILETEKEDHTSEDSALRDGDQSVGSMKFGQESGYSSLSDSLAVPQAHFLRLLPPSKPQMIERSFESLASLRRSASLKDNNRRPVERSEMGGSFKTRLRHKAQNRGQLAL